MAAAPSAPPPNPCPGWAVPQAPGRPRSFLAPRQQGIRGGGRALHARRVGLPEVTVSTCVLSIFSRVCTAGTWPAHCVRSSYLVGCVICRGVAKGSGNVDSFQHNHMSLPPPAPALPPAPCRPHRLPGRCWGGRRTRTSALSPSACVHCFGPWMREDSKVSGARPPSGLRPQC